MDEIQESKLRRSIHGVASIERTERGLACSRLPAWTYSQHAGFPVVAKMAERLSGARMEIDTEATEITVTYRALRDAAPEFGWEAGPSTLTVVVGDYDESISHTNGDLRIWQGEEVREIIRGEDSVATFSLQAAVGSRRVTIWLPHNSPIEILALESNADWQPFDVPAGRRWVHYGSSISHCEDAATPLKVWPAAVARALDLDLYSVALSGGCHLDQFVARTIRDAGADVISLKVGINIVNGASMTERTFVSAVHGFLDTIREGNSTASILVISPICCPGHEDKPGPSAANDQGIVDGQPYGPHTWIGELSLRRMRELLAEVVAVRAAQDSNIQYMDGLELYNFDEAQAMPDGIHPNSEGYEQIAKNF